MRITKQPTDKAKKDKETLSLSCVVDAGRSTFVNHQWYRDGAKLEGQTSDTLERKLSLADDGAKWWCRITNDVGTVETRHASTTVKPLKKVIEINENVQNLNLYDEYTRRFPNAEDVEKVEFIIRKGVEVTSRSTSKPALDTGARWDSNISLKLSILSGAVIAGRGGEGGDVVTPQNISQKAARDGLSGGLAFMASREVDIDNDGIIGGGGGGGGGAAQFSLFSSDYTMSSGGGGGASYANGGKANLAGGGRLIKKDGTDGEVITGGAGGQSSYSSARATGGNGGGLGEPGENGYSTSFEPGAGGTAGHAIQGVSNVTFINRGDIRGKTI